MAFTWFDKFTEVLAAVPAEQRDELAVAIVAYGAFGEERELAYPLNALFAALREDVDNSRDMRERGRRGGRPAKPQAGKVPETQKPEVPETQKPEVSQIEKPELSEIQKPNPNQTNPIQTRPKRERARARGFTPPTVAEVDEYRRSKGYAFDAEAFVAYYAARGWKTSRGAPIKDWRAACTTWSKNEGRFGGGKETDDGWADRYG